MISVVAVRTLRVAMLAIAGMVAYVTGILIISPNVSGSDSLGSKWCNVALKNWDAGLIVAIAVASSEIFAVTKWQLHASTTRRVALSGTISLLTYVISQCLLIGAIELGVVDPDYAARQRGDENPIVRLTLIAIPLYILFSSGVLAYLRGWTEEK